VRMNRRAWLAHFLRAMTADRVDQMRLHVIAVFGHQLPHCFEVGPQCWKNRRE